MNELKVDECLLINNFDTYKLSLEKLRTSRVNIPEGIRIKNPNDEQFSFLHHKEFSFHNHLYADVWNDNNVYLITFEGQVKRALINLQTENIMGLIDVWKIPERSDSKACNFNASINFPSSEMAVITDGFGYLYIIDTSCRKEVQQWKTLFANKVLGEKREFKLACSQLEDGGTQRKVHCVLHLVEASLAKSTNKTGFQTVLTWLIFTEGNKGDWEKLVVNTWRGDGSTDYVFLELGCQALLLASDCEFYSSEMEKTSQKIVTPVEPDYKWQQSRENVKLWFQIPSCSDKSELKLDVTSNSVNIYWKERLLLFGTLSQRIDAKLTTWELDNFKLQVVMQKEELGVVWTSLLCDSDKCGEQVINEEFVAQVHQKLEHLCSENEEHQGGTLMLNSGDLEECDAFGECRYLWRLIGSGLVTHKILLGSEQWLFSIQFDGVRLPAFCMRRDVDGLVWQPLQPQPETPQFNCNHIHTFPAFGYIAASRQKKKFLVAPPDFSYAAIIDSVGHVTVFRKTNLSGDLVLRNRRTSAITKSLYVQNLVNLDSNSQTVGAVAYNKYMFVLTTNDLVMINF